MPLAAVAGAQSSALPEYEDLEVMWVPIMPVSANLPPSTAQARPLPPLAPPCEHKVVGGSGASVAGDPGLIWLHSVTKGVGEAEWGPR